ncbi:hypothetical protein BN8_00243 [Fibrisoma limi BUZ 3]|uniref:Lipoprotein n=1 Tax=Fibrisoma limi BUZ 3 TaxID=1185876 RepID=I2GBQ1_9BACT|nr:hypothetical protein [Fibrisoma limi]CCH51325.1 hypothetical protein BN8_00243 [Fibrisoma limi BUZ 3]
MKQLLFSLAVLATAASCEPPQANDDQVPPGGRVAAIDVGGTPPPAKAGLFTFWTSTTGWKFDRIDIRLNADTVGTITTPFLITSQHPVPECGLSIPKMLVVAKRPAGQYVLKATATKGGQVVKKWSGTLTFAADECRLFRFILQ